MFSRFRMPSDVVEEVLEDCLMVLVYRHDQLARPDRWLLRTVRFRCVRYWRKRRSDTCLRAQREILSWLQDETCTDEERERRRGELKRYLDPLPARCQQLLGELFHFIPPSEPPETPADSAEYFVPRGIYRAESRTVRCMTHLLQRLLKDPPEDLEDLPLP